MQSNQQTGAMKKLGHTRRQSYGKIMPISSILTNLIKTESKNVESPSTDNTEKMSTTKPSFESFAMQVKVNERSDASDNRSSAFNSIMNFIELEKINDRYKNPVDEFDSNAQFLKCVNYHHRNNGNSSNETIETSNAKNDIEDDIDRLLLEKNEENVMHEMCTTADDKDKMNKTYDFKPLHLLCEKLCNDSCNTSTKACQSSDDNVTHSSRLSTDSSCGSDVKALNDQSTASPKSDRQKFLSSMLDVESQQIEPKCLMNDDDIDTDDTDNANALPLTIENLKQFNENYFREKFALAETLANTSLMNSPAVRLRLAARKIEMNLNTTDSTADDFDEADYVPPKDLLMYLVR